MVATVAAAAVLVAATNLTDGLPAQLTSFRMVVTGLSVAEGLTGVPTGETGTVTLSTVS